MPRTKAVVLNLACGKEDTGHDAIIGLLVVWFAGEQGVLPVRVTGMKLDWGRLRGDMILLWACGSTVLIGVQVHESLVHICTYTCPTD